MTAFCGAMFAPGEAELLAWFDGMPCTACANRRPNTHRSAPPSMPASGKPNAPVAQRRRALPDRPAPGAPALGLRDERLVHRVPDRPLLSSLDGRTVVLARCGALAWTTSHEPPPEWPRCDECAPTKSSVFAERPITARAAPAGREVASA